MMAALCRDAATNFEQMIPTTTNLRPEALAQTPVFDLALAQLLGGYASDAYLPAVPKRPGISSGVFLFSEKTDAKVLVMESPVAVVLAFRGTSNLKDWIADARFRKVPLGAPGDIRVHDGFLQDADSLLPKIINAINGNPKPILVCGHSLGGALASLSAFCLAKSNFEVRSVYTFASPRVGNAAWRDAYNAQRPNSNPNWTLGDRTFRVAAAGDLVPYLPGALTPPLNGYRHVGTEIFVEATDIGASYAINPGRWIDFWRDERRAMTAIGEGEFDLITRFHSMGGDYLPLMAKCGEH
jgi:hypothetical protein